MKNHAVTTLSTFQDSASGKRRAKSRLAELTAQRGVEKTPVDVEQ